MSPNTSYSPIPVFFMELDRYEFVTPLYSEDNAIDISSSYRVFCTSLGGSSFEMSTCCIFFESKKTLRRSRQSPTNSIAVIRACRCQGWLKLFGSAYKRLQFESFFAYENQKGTELFRAEIICLFCYLHRCVAFTMVSCFYQIVLR